MVNVKIAKMVHMLMQTESNVPHKYANLMRKGQAEAIAKDAQTITFKVKLSPQNVNMQHVERR